MENKNRQKLLVGALLLMVVILSACKPDIALSPTPSAVMPTAVASPTATAEPERVLTICSAQEPENLYLYDGYVSRAKWNILEALYDGPIDKVDGQTIPVIIDTVPTLANGGLQLLPTEALAGQFIVDARGELNVLQMGVSVRPSGCNSSDCVITWDGSTPLLMDVMQLTYKFKDGLLWSDGQPLVAADSVFSYVMAKVQPTTPQQWALDRTASYQAVDETQVVWQGIPGFSSGDASLFLWLPLPEHQLAGLAMESLVASGDNALKPLGWGAYRIEKWAVGDRLELTANPLYFRATEQLPAYDRLIFKFISDADEALAAWKDGRCQILDESIHLENRLPAILEDQAIESDALHIMKAASWTGVVFGITPAAYDDGFTPLYGDRERFFDDARTRQTFAMCIDRQRIVDELTFGKAAIPGDIYGGASTAISTDRDVVGGKALLAQVGWKDVVGDGVSPLQAWGVSNVTNGTPFSISLSTSQSAFDQQAAIIIQQSLAECGVEVAIESLPAQVLFAPGPQGRLFGRQFDMALFAWADGSQNPCSQYQSWEMPNRENGWVGSNIAGYQSAEYDRACSDLGLGTDVSAHADLANLLQNALPVIPISYGLRVILVDSAVVFMVDEANIRSLFSLIEGYN